MKVLFFVNTSWNILNFRSGLIKALQKKGYSVSALAPVDEYSSNFEELNVSYHHIAMDNSGTNPLKDFSLLIRLYRRYKNIKPDLILHYTIKPNIYGALVARYLNIPCINTVSGLGTTFLTDSYTNKFARWLYRITFRFPEAIFFQNVEDQQEFVKHALLTKENYHQIGGSGINLERFPETVLPPDKPFTFLMLSRLLIDKGVLEFVKAAQLVSKLNPSVRFILAGKSEPTHRRGIATQDIQNWAKQTWFDYVGEHSDVRPLISQSHAVVLPSYREGLSKALLEAAAMGRPIIASDVPGCRQVVNDQINGLLCQPKSIRDLADKMEQVINLPMTRLEEMGSAGRKHVADHFDEKIVISNYLREIESILKTS